MCEVIYMQGQYGKASALFFKAEYVWKSDFLATGAGSGSGQLLGLNLLPAPFQ